MKVHLEFGEAESELEADRRETKRNRLEDVTEGQMDTGKLARDE